mmetsp:Transcript_9327/g.30789  ORF Transcript_9327/g.30789 Transcript_9327/m.30789 type:complete len:273 (-) Transcript_9327:978-1796(-)
MLRAVVEPVRVLELLDERRGGGAHGGHVPVGVEELCPALVLGPALDGTGPARAVAEEDFGSDGGDDGVGRGEALRFFVAQERRDLADRAAGVVHENGPRERGVVFPIAPELARPAVKVLSVSDHGPVEIGHHHDGRLARAGEGDEAPVHELVPSGPRADVHSAPLWLVGVALAVADDELERGSFREARLHDGWPGQERLARSRRHCLFGLDEERVPHLGRDAHPLPRAARADVSHRHLEPLVRGEVLLPASVAAAAAARPLPNQLLLAPPHQ